MNGFFAVELGTRVVRDRAEATGESPALIAESLVPPLSIVIASFVLTSIVAGADLQSGQVGGQYLESGSSPSQPVRSVPAPEAVARTFGVSIRFGDQVLRCRHLRRGLLKTSRRRRTPTVNTL